MMYCLKIAKPPAEKRTFFLFFQKATDVDIHRTWFVGKDSRVTVGRGRVGGRDCFGSIPTMAAVRCWRRGDALPGPFDWPYASTL
jgi:hypothetical protein